MNSWIRVGCVALCGLGAFVCGVGDAYADKCVGASLRVEKAPGAKPPFELSLDADQRIVLRDTASREDVWLSVFPQHFHVTAFIPKHSKYFILIARSAGHRLDQRIAVISRQGELLEGISLRDLVPVEERTQMSRSVSHIHWLQSAAFSADATQLVLTLSTGRIVTFGLPSSAGYRLKRTNVPPVVKPSK